MLNRRIIYFLIAVSLLTGCSVELRYKIMTFVFDGVPDPNKEETIYPKDTVSVEDSIVSQHDPELNINPKIYYHKPYQERKCTKCHNQNNMGELQGGMPGLCYNCHNNLADKYQFLHGPVGAGYCNACHKPHSSDNDNLLLKTDVDLCLDCHLAQDIYSNEIHAKQESYSCSECHNAHGGDDISLQKPGTCYRCHEDFKQKYKYLHGPVAGGYCKSCHTSHMTKTKYLLIGHGRQLCLHCHKEERILDTETHNEIQDADCIDCHNPHGGETTNFLN